MKPYIIAALLFLIGVLGLGVLTANLMAPPKPKPQAHAVPQHKPVGGYCADAGRRSRHTRPQCRIRRGIPPDTACRTLSGPPGIGLDDARNPAEHGHFAWFRLNARHVGSDRCLHHRLAAQSSQPIEPTTPGADHPADRSRQRTNPNRR